MKGLATLIKLHKRDLDILRKKLVTLESQKAQLELLISRLQDELVRELELAGKTPEMGAFFGDFSKRIRTRQDQIRKEIQQLDKKIATARDDVAAAFSEIKKFEIALENAKKRKQAQENRRETILLDEVASQQHHRHKDTQ